MKFAALVLSAALAPLAPAQPSFVNWETPTVNPIAMTPDGSRLLVGNLADDRLEVFDIASGTPIPVGSVFVGLDPVSVRARSNSEAWVVNHISDSVSIVDLSTLRVVRTLRTADEPCDVVFAGSAQLAFVSCSQANLIQVWNPANLSNPPLTLPIEGEDPRALAVSPDGMTVYAAIFESGNRSTILGGGADGAIGFPPNAVSDPASPYAGAPNPPPNSGSGFSPPIAGGLPTPPRVGLIVRKNDAGKWMDDNAHDWSALASGANADASGRIPGWDLADHDLAVINANSLSVTYATGLMNICMHVGVNPSSGGVWVVGTDATNEVRFEPNANGKFIRVNAAAVHPETLAPNVTDLNPHLTYAASTIPQSERNRSLGDPRAIAWNAAGTRAYVAGMGSNNLVVINAAGARAGLTDTIEVGEGPAGLALDEVRGRLYVLNRFEGSISVVSLASESELTRVQFFDPTPAAVRAGRKHLYDSHKNSGLGHIACASCHVDARMDRLAWDLGDPSGAMDALDTINQGFNFPGLEPNTTPTPFAPFHPMKGPMTTQTLQHIIGMEPFHWRGDRNGIEDFNGAFIGLQGDDTNLTTTEMQEFEDFLATVTFPPNPFRNFDNSLPTSLPLPGHYRTGRFGSAGQPLPNGNAVNGLSIYRGTANRRLDGNALACVTCHTLPTGAGPDSMFNGAGFTPIPVGPRGEHHLALVSVDGSTQTAIKIPQLRNQYEKTGFVTLRTPNTAGFGVLHDGSVDSIERFVSEPVFTVASDQEVANLTALLLAFSGGDFGPPPGGTFLPEPPGPPSKDTRASVGQQTTLMNAAAPEPGQLTLISQMLTQADLNRVGVIVKGRLNGQARGWRYNGGNVFQSDRAGETISAASLQALASPGSELTYTVVVKGMETRTGIDRDEDGILDADEAGPCDPDLNADGNVDQDDVAYLVNVIGGGENPSGIDPDFNLDGNADQDDIAALINVIAGGPCP
jgi:YVTN family beta-propeller protein